MMNFRAIAMLCALGLLTSVALADDLQLNPYFTDGVVLQRNKPVVIRGTADADASVTVTFADQGRQVSVNQDGTWSATLDPMPASIEGRELKVTDGGATIRLNGVLVGDVFLFARQTSIDVTLGQQQDGRKIAESQPPMPRVRTISIKTIPAAKPMPILADASTTGWGKLTPDRAVHMSAAAYFFANYVSMKVEAPVGVIDLNMGPNFPISWLSRESLKETEKFYGRSNVPGMLKRFDALYEAHYNDGPAQKKSPIKGDPLENPLFPAAGYNAVLAPLQGVGLKAIVLQIGGNYPYVKYEQLQQQGEHLDHAKLNAAYVETYDIRKNGFRMDPVTTPRIPRQWRDALGDPDLPIGLVLAPSSGLGTLADHAIEMRELQRKIAMDNPNMGLIMPGMEAVPFSVQPADEHVLGVRSSQWVLGDVYHKEQAVATGPIFGHAELSHNTARIHFQPGTADGLKSTDDSVQGFEVAGVTGDYLPAQATIKGNVIEIESDQINRIARVRYNWQQMPTNTLVNSAGLPAIPFRTEDATYHWFHRHAEDDLPSEYFTPANEWTGGDVTLVNGQIKTFGYKNFAGWLGPIGIRVGPFGPNMGVRDVLVGSPAEGKLTVGDVIYSANGVMLGDDAPRVMSQQITESEKAANGGKLVLGLRRGGENMDVELTLEVMGTYGPIAPYDCPKSEKIVADLEHWLAVRGGKYNNFLSTESLFLLGAGSPEHQRLVRRFVYSKLDFKGNAGSGVNWYLGYDSILLAEYYLATGDRTVLPALERMTDNIVANQIEEADAGPMTGRLGGWYGKRKAFRNYPTMPSAGLACMIGLTLAKEAGVPVDEAAYQAGLEHFRRKGAPVGFIIYGNAYRDEPQPLDPQRILNGTLSSDNGKLSLGAVLFQLAGDRPTADYLSLISTYAYNHTYDGHGGNFWNNFWTPLASNIHSQAAFIHFMKGHRWYRELNRMFDGSMIVSATDRVGGGHGLALVVPQHRLRILGAPDSPFAPGAPALLKPALDAHANREYATCEQLVTDLLASGEIGKTDLPTVEKLLEEAQRIQASIEADLDRLEMLVEAGRFHEAKLDIPQLERVIPTGNQRFADIKQAMAHGKPRPNDAEQYAQWQKTLIGATSARMPVPGVESQTWTCVVSEPSKADAKKKEMGQVEPKDASVWRMKIVENKSQAPQGWMKPGFDDSTWDSTTLPISWHLNHTALLRTTFNIDDRDAIDGLRFRAWLFRQQDIEIYLNGELIGRVNNLEKKTANVDAMFEPGALKHLKNGENTLAVTTRQNWRWGMLFMRVYNDGFGFRLDIGKAKPNDPSTEQQAK